jgi:hypothetical protein
MIDANDPRLSRRERDQLRAIEARLGDRQRRPSAPRPHLQELPADYRAKAEAMFRSCCEDGDLDERGKP